MTLAAIATNAANFRQIPPVSAALKRLTAMLRSEQAFDLEIVEGIEEFLRQLPDEHASLELVECLLQIQQVFHQQLLFRRAAPSGLKAIRWARKLGDSRLLARALSCRGALASDGYDMAIGLEAHLEALRIAKNAGDVDRVAVCYYNIAVVMQRLGRYRGAMACVKASQECFAHLSKKFVSIRWIALNLLSDLSFRRRDWLAALEHARTAQIMCAQLDESGDMADISRTHYACAIQNEVSALARLSDVEGARNALERLREVVSRYGSAHNEGYLQLAVAISEGFAGNVEEAAVLLRDFERWPQSKDEALQCLIDIYERAGRPDQALSVTRELLETVRAARREVFEADLAQIDISPLDDDNGIVQELAARSAVFEVEAHRIGDRFNAKLAYLFELGVNAELREEDTYTGEHIYRVGRLCAALAIDAGLGEEMCWLAELAGRLHDVGKASVPSHVILKSDALTDGEKEILRLHAEDGAALIAQLAEPRLIQVVSAVRHHHEKWEGTGYPRQLKGDEIPILARIVAICDSFDAMTHSRPFRSARPIASGLEEIERCAGGHFEPRLAGLFVNLVRRLQREHGDLDEYLGEPGRRTRWAKSHPELMRLLEDRRTTL